MSVVNEQQANEQLLSSHEKRSDELLEVVCEEHQTGFTTAHSPCEHSTKLSVVLVDVYSLQE